MPVSIAVESILVEREKYLFVSLNDTVSLEMMPSVAVVRQSPNDALC